MKFAAWYGIVVGLLMIGQWTLSIISGGVPEFETAPLEIAFHLAAEMVTVVLLVAGGIASLRSAGWGRQILLVGLGMLIYSEIVSPGYFAQQGQWMFVSMFVALLAGALLSVAFLFKQRSKLGNS